MRKGIRRTLIKKIRYILEAMAVENCACASQEGVRAANTAPSGSRAVDSCLDGDCWGAGAHALCI